MRWKKEYSIPVEATQEEIDRIRTQVGLALLKRLETNRLFDVKKTKRRTYYTLNVVAFHEGVMREAIGGISYLSMMKLYGKEARKRGWPKDGDGDTGG